VSPDRDLLGHTVHRVVLQQIKRASGIRDVAFAATNVTSALRLSAARTTSRPIRQSR
jgi:hypothetical protein